MSPVFERYRNSEVSHGKRHETPLRRDTQTDNMGGGCRGVDDQRVLGSQSTNRFKRRPLGRRLSSSLYDLGITDLRAPAARPRARKKKTKPPAKKSDYVRKIGAQALRKVYYLNGVNRDLTGGEPAETADYFSSGAKEPRPPPETERKRI